MSEPTARDLDKLHVESGDILILRVPRITEQDALVAHQQLAGRIRNHFYANDIDDVLILVLGPETDLSVVDDEAMALAGWVRSE